MALLMTIGTKLDERGLRKAQHSFKRLGHSLKGALGGALGALGLGMGIRELINMAEAANQDTKSAKLLSDQLHRMAKATKSQRDEAEAFIQTLSMQTGIIDDTLRPSLTELTASTKDVGKAQKLLSAVLDISAGRGKSVEAVQKAVTKSYSGNITVLQRMFPEMKKFADNYKANKGHALTFAESVDLGRKMIKKMADDNIGQASKMATPFDKMAVAMDNLKENIGGVLMPTIEKIVPKIQEMVTAFGTPNSPENKALADLSGSMELLAGSVEVFFRNFDPKKQSGVVGFMKTLNDFALGAAYGIESFNAGIDALNGKEFDASKYPVLSKGAKPLQQKVANNWWKAIPVAGSWIDFAVQGANAMQSGNKSMPVGGATINMYGVVGDKVAVGKAVKEALDAYNKNNGHK